MKVYQVGGSVRDALLNLPVSDRDYVVVGATPESMVAAGYKPVGRDFPVFLHPETHEEYALARTERKTAPGYQGFVFHTDSDVTLEDDLARRDFTINAMARAEDGTLTDPYDGQADLQAGVLRHVSPAFAEDPVRILRCARFAARFGFTVAPETMALMRRMSENGEVDALVAERVWQELSRGLMEADPVRMFAVLDACGALPRVLPECGPWRVDTDSMRALAAAAKLGLTLPVRFAAFAGTLKGARLIAMCERLRAPAECRDLAVLYVRNAAMLAGAGALDAAGLADLLRRADGLRQPGRFHTLVAVAHVYAEGARGDHGYRAVVKRLTLALETARGIDAGAIARGQPNAAAIAEAVHAARVAAIEAALAHP
jgi:tRNA nucleotidyltransferase (CCA-adding enzyme)